MGFQMGARKPCLVFLWMFYLLCGLHLLINCFGSELVFSKVDNVCKYPISAPVHPNAGAESLVSGCVAAAGRTQRAANTAHAPYKILDSDKRFRPPIFVSSLRSLSSTGETVSTVAFTKKAPEDYAHPSQWHPLVSKDAIPPSVIHGKNSSYRKLVLPLLRDTRALAGPRRKEETSQNSNSTVFIPHLKPIGTIYTTTLDVEGKAFDTAQGPSHCSKLPAETNLEHGQNLPQSREAKQEKVNSSASSSKGSRRSSSTSRSASRARPGSRTRRGLSGYEGNIKTGSGSSSETRCTKLETVRCRTALRFDPPLKRAASRNCWGSRRKNNVFCADTRRRSSRSSSDPSSATKSSEHTTSSTNKNTTAVDRSQSTRYKGSSTSRSTNSSSTKSRILNTKRSKTHPKKNSNGSSNSSTTSSECSSVSTNNYKTSGRVITEEIDTSGATGLFRRSGPQRDSTDSEPQQRRPVAIIRLRLCHFTDFHSAYEFNKTHPLHNFHSCCPQNAATFGDREIDESTASCPAKKDCTSKHDEEAAVVGGDDGGIWRVPVLQYILDSLCPNVSPTSAVAVQSPKPTTSVKRRTSKPKHTLATAVGPADAGRSEAANTPVKGEPALDAKAGSDNYVWRDAFAVRPTNVDERKYTTSCPAEKAHGDTQEEQRRRTEARPTVKIQQGRRIRGCPLRGASRKLPKLRKQYNETSAEEPLHQNLKGRMAADSFRECPTWTSIADADISPATGDLKCNGGSVLKIRNGYMQTNHSSSHPVQTKDNLQMDTPIWNSECNTGGPESSTLRSKKGVQHILREGKNYNTNSTSSPSNLKTQCSSRLSSNCRNGCCCANSTSGSKDTSMPTKEKNCSYVTKLTAGTDDSAPAAEFCSEQAEEESSCTRPALSGCVTTKVQEQVKGSVVQNESEGFVPVVPYSLRLFGGDAVPGSDFDVLGAELPGKLLKELKVQVATLGNHEFDRGWQIVDEMFAGNQNFTTLVVSNASTNLSLDAKPRNLFPANSLRDLHGTTLHSVNAEEPKMRSKLQSTSTIAEALSPRISMTRHLQARQTTYRKETAPRHSTDLKSTLCRCSFARHSRMLGETIHVPRCERKSLASRVIREPFRTAGEKRKTSFNKAEKNVTHPSSEQISEHLHEGESSAVGSAFPLDRAGQSSQQSEPDRSEYTVPYVLWLANVHGDFVLLKPQQLVDIHRICRAREAQTTVPGTLSATAGEATASFTRPGSAGTPAEAESEIETNPFMSLLKVKQPAAAVCLLGALPKDLRTSAAPPADVDVRSEKSTQRIELALRQCTESYWKLLRTCSEALQQSLRKRVQYLSRDTQLKGKMKQPVHPGEHHGAAAQQQIQPHLGQRSNSCADSSLQRQQQIKPDPNRSGQQQQQQQRHAMAVRGRLTRKKIDGSEKEERGAADFLQAAPHREPSEQQRRHVNNSGTRGAASTEPKSSPLKDNPEGRPKELPSRSKQQEGLTDRSWTQSAFRFKSDSSHFDTGGQRMNAPASPRPVGVLLSHLGFGEEQRIAAERGGAAGGIDVIFSGHSHTELPSHMFPAFVKQMKPGQREAALTGDTAADQSLPSDVAALTAGGSHQDLPNLSGFAGAEADAEGNRAGTVDRQRCEGKGDEEPDSEDRDGEDEVDGERAGPPQATPQTNGQKEDELPQEIKNSYGKNWHCDNNINTKQLQSRKTNKQMRSAKKGHILPTKQRSSLEKQHIGCGRNKHCSSTKKRSRSTYDQRNNRLDQHSDSARQHSRSFFHKNISPPPSSNTWQSGSFIITSASHGKRISLVDIYFLVFDQKGGDVKRRTHGVGEGGVFTEIDRGNGKKNERQQARTDDEEERQDVGGEGLGRKMNHSTELKDTSVADGIDETQSHTDKNVWWLQSEQLPPVFSTVDVDDFAIWASSAKSFLGESIAGDTAGTGRKIRTVSSRLSVETKTAIGKAVAPDCAITQAETTQFVQGEGTRGGVATAPGNRSCVNEEREAWSSDTSLHAPSVDAAVSQQRGKSHSQAPGQRALSCERNCNSNATANSSLGNTNDGSSGFLSELHGAVAYEYVCLDKRYGESFPLQQQKDLQGPVKNMSAFMQSFTGTPRTTGNISVPFNTETTTRWRFTPTAQQREVETLPVESTPAITRRTELKAIAVAETNRRAAAVATGATKNPYFRCSPTTQPIPALAWHSSSFSFSRYNSNELARLVQPDQSKVEKVPAATSLNLGSDSLSFVACVPRQHSSQSSAKSQGVYRIPYFGWLPAYSAQTAFAPPRSDQLEIEKQPRQQQYEYNSCQHMQEQSSSRPESHSQQHQPSCRHQRQQEQQQQRTDSPTNPQESHSQQHQPSCRHQRQQEQQQQRTDSPTNQQPRRRPHATIESYQWASRQQLRQDYEDHVSLLSVESSMLPAAIAPLSGERCYRLGSPVPLFPILSPPTQPSPLLPYRGSMQPAQSQVGFSASSLLTGSNGADGAASTGDSNGVAAVAVAVVEGHQPLDHIFCRAAINAALVCPYSKIISNLRYERRRQSRSRGIAVAKGVDGSFDTCRRSECPMGRLVSDALRYTALKALLWRPTSENECTVTTQEATELVPPATGETARMLMTTVSILTDATAIRRKGAVPATVRTAPSKQAANVEHFSRKFERDVRRRPEEAQRTERNNGTARDTGAELERSVLDTDELMGKKKGAFYTLNQSELERIMNHRKTARRPVKGNDGTHTRCNTIFENRKAHIRDKVRKQVDAPLRGKIAEAWSRVTIDTRDQGAVSKRASDGISVQHKGVAKIKKKWSLDAELVSIEAEYNTENSPRFEQEKDGQLLLQSKNVCAIHPSLSGNRKETPADSWPESQQYFLKPHEKSSRRSGKPHNQKKRQQQQQQQPLEESQQKQPKQKKWLWQKQREEKLGQQRKVHPPMVQQPTEWARMLQQQVNQQDSEEFLEHEKCGSLAPTKRTFLGVVAMQTAGNIRSSFCPSCSLTDAEIDNVLPWSSHLRVIKLPIHDFLVLSSRSVQKLMNSGSCILNTPEAAHLFPHLSRFKVAASGRQTMPQPKAPLLSLPHHCPCCHACTTRTHQEHDIDNSIAACKRSRLGLYSKYYSRRGSPCTSSMSSGNSACDCYCCAWTRSENDNEPCGRSLKRRGKQEAADCTVLPFCAPDKKENALESPSILLIAGARLEIRLLQQCSRANHSGAAEDGTDGANYVQVLEPRKFQVSSAGSRQATEEVSQQIFQCFLSPASKRKTSHTDISSSHANECKYKESSPSIQPCAGSQQDKSSYAALAATPDYKQVSSPPSLHAAKLSVYIPVYPLPVAVEAMQTGKTHFQYLFKGKLVSMAGFLNDRQDERSTKDDGAKTTSAEREEGIDYLWVKAETTQLLNIRIKGNVKGRCLVEERKARWGNKSGDECVSVADDVAGNNHEFESGRPEECNGRHREKKREKASRTRHAKCKGNNEADDEKDRVIHKKSEVEEFEQTNMAKIHKGQRNGKLGQRRKIEAEEAIEGEEEEREPADSPLTNTSMLPVYIQRRLLQHQPLLLQHLENILRPNTTGAHASTGTLMPCSKKSQGSQRDTQNTHFRSFSPLTEAAAENEYSRTKYEDKNEQSTLLPLCWVRQHITPAAKEKNNGSEQLKQGRTEQLPRMEIGTSAYAVSKEDASAANGMISGQPNKTQILSAAELRGEHTSRFHTDDELLRTFLDRSEIKQRACSQQPGPSRHQRKGGARQLTQKRVRKRKMIRQIGSAPAFRNTNMYQRETTGAPEDKPEDPKPSEEEPAVVPLSSILLLGVVDQFFLQGGDQLLLNDDAYTFNVTALPAVESSQINVHNNATARQSQRQKGGALQYQDRDRDACSSQALQKRQQGQHHKQQSQDEQQPHGQQHIGTFPSELRGSLAVDASFNIKTARDALGEFIQMKHDRNERIGASSFQRLLIRLKN